MPSEYTHLVSCGKMIQVSSHWDQWDSFHCLQWELDQVLNKASLCRTSSFGPWALYKLCPGAWGRVTGWNLITWCQTVDFLFFLERKYNVIKISKEPRAAGGKTSMFPFSSTQLCQFSPTDSPIHVHLKYPAASTQFDDKDASISALTS